MPRVYGYIADFGPLRLVPQFNWAKFDCEFPPSGPSFQPGDNRAIMSGINATEMNYILFKGESVTVCDQSNFVGKSNGYVYILSEFKIYDENDLWTSKYCYIGIRLVNTYDNNGNIQYRLTLSIGRTNASHEIEVDYHYDSDIINLASSNAKCNIAMCQRTYEGYTYYGLVLFKADTTDPYNQQFQRNTLWFLKSTFGGACTSGDNTKVGEETDPNKLDPDPESEEGGGGGGHDPSSDIVTEEDITTLNSIKGGFITYYKITDAQLETLAAELFSSTIWDAIKNFFEKPQEIIAGMILLPITPASGSTYHPKYGINVLQDVSLPEVGARFKDVSCGSVYVDEYYGSSFDYSPFTQISIYLPFIGVRDLDVDEIMGKWLTVNYRIDCYTGNCLASILVGTGVAGSNTVRYQFSGNCGQQMPISSVDFSQIINGAIQFATVAAVSVMTAGGAGAAAGAAATEAGASAAESGMIAESAQAAATTKAAADIGGAAISQVMNAKPIIGRSGSVGESIGMMSVLKPYLIRKIPRQSLPGNYKHYKGYPSNMTSTIGGLSGYSIMDSVQLQGIPGTDGEIAEIDRILKGGFYA